MQQININPDTAEHLRLIANLIDLNASDKQIKESITQNLSVNDIKAIQKMIATTQA